jgi:uncharacterized membrane protein YphA (DoxX/SURF4 family)
MDWVLLAGRIAFAALFIPSGIQGHVLDRSTSVPYARAMGAPLPELSVPVSGLAIAAAGILVVLGIWVDLASLVLAASVLGFAYWMHAFWKVDDPQMRAMQRAHFMKNVAIAGAALGLFYLFNQFGPAIGLTIGDGRLFGKL